MRSVVVFDVGETLVDETGLWASWAQELGVPPFTLYGVLGGLAARGEDHQRFLELVRPDLRWPYEDKRPWQLTAADLYPDALDCLRQLKTDGWTVVVGGNQPAAIQRLGEELDLPVDHVTSSGTLGATKPDPAFFRAVAAQVGVRPEECVHVGDRVDNDVVAARVAGMLPVHVVRGPWGVLHADDSAIDLQVRSLAELPALLAAVRAG
ncbi:MAG: HAD family hydrolase [Mycobacteriales bacterium]